MAKLRAIINDWWFKILFWVVAILVLLKTYGNMRSEVHDLKQKTSYVSLTALEKKYDYLIEALYHVSVEKLSRSNQIIRDSQRILNEYGFYSLRDSRHIDGRFAWQTRNAMNEFQKNQNLQLTRSLTLGVYMKLKEYELMQKNESGRS